MKDIKMSDVFDLPMSSYTTDDGYGCIFDMSLMENFGYALRIKGGYSGKVDDATIDDAIVIAINAYDDNQKRIAELEQQLIDLQQSHDDEIEMIEDVNNALIASLNKFSK